MKPRTLAVLAALVLGLAAFIWLYERKLPSTEERAAQAKKVLRLKSEEVNVVSVEWEGRRVRLQREAPAPKPAEEDEAPPSPNWRLSEPLEAAADRFAVERLLDALTGLEKQRTLESPDRKSLGLDPPRAKVTLAGKEGETVLEVGAEIPASSALALAVAGRPEVYVVSNSAYADLTKEPGEWRSRDLFPGQRADVERVTLAGSGRQLLLAKRGEVFWLESPFADRADREQVDRLLTDLTSVRVHTFVDQPARPPAELGLEPPLATVEAVLEGRETPFRVQIGGPSAGDPPRRYAREGSQVFETESKLLESLDKPAQDWRSRALSALEVYQVDKASITDAQGAVEVERSGPDWKRGADMIGFAAGSDLLYAVTGARGEKLLAREEAARQGATLAKPELTLVLTASDKTSETLTLYPPLAEGAVPAMAAGREVVLLLPKAAADDIRAKLEALRKAEPLPGKDKKPEPEQGEKQEGT